MLVSNYGIVCYSCNPGDNGSWRHRHSALKIALSLVSAAAPQTTKQASFREQEETVRETGLRDHHLGVAVATAHSIITLKMAVHTPFPKLAHSHVSM